MTKILDKTHKPPTRKIWKLGKSKSWSGTLGLAGFVSSLLFFLLPKYLGLGSREAHHLEMLMGADKKNSAKESLLSLGKGWQVKNYPACSLGGYRSKSCTPSHPSGHHGSGLCSQSSVPHTLITPPSVARCLFPGEPVTSSPCSDETVLLFSGACRENLTATPRAVRRWHLSPAEPGGGALAFTGTQHNRVVPLILQNSVGKTLTSSHALKWERSIPVQTILW